MRFLGHRRTLTCRRAVELITDYLEDLLPAAQRADLQHHLDGCPHCAAYLAQLQATIAASGQVDADTLEPGMRDELIALYRRTLR